MPEIFHVMQITVYWLIYKIQVHIASIQGAEFPKSRNDFVFIEQSVGSLGPCYKFPNMQNKTLLPTFYLNECTCIIIETVLTSKYVIITGKKKKKGEYLKYIF